MSNHLLYINIEENNWKKALPEVENLSGEALDRTFEYVEKNTNLSFLKLGKPVAISLNLTNDESIQQLNAEYRGHDKPTNVLSFAQIDNDDFDSNCQTFDDIELGDIIISLDTLQKEATEKNIPLSNHFRHLFMHGLLHLLGFDHTEDNQAEEMEAIEVKILKTMSINNPYE